MVDLRINMVRASGQHNTPPSGFLKIIQSFLPFLIHHFPGVIQLFPAGFGRSDHFFCRQIRKAFYQLFCYCIKIGKGDKRIIKADIFRPKILHIILDILCVGGDNRTIVMVLGLRELLALVGDTGVEDILHSLLDQPLHMSVSKFRRVAFRLAGDGFDSQLIDLPGRGWREYHTVFQVSEKPEPEWIVLVHIQYSRNSHSPANCLIFLQR